LITKLPSQVIGVTVGVIVGVTVVVGVGVGVGQIPNVDEIIIN
jgi:hypothetical protein